MKAPLWIALLLLAHLAGWLRWLDLPALALLALGWGASLDRAVPLAWGLGLMLDAASLGGLGPQALAWSGAAAALCVEQRATHRRELPTLMLAAGLVSLWLGAATGWLGPPGFGGTFGFSGIWRLLSLALPTALFAPVLLWPLRRDWARRRPA